MKQAILVGLAGGSGSGKSWLSRYLKEELKGKAVIVCQDWYYKDNGHITGKDSEKLNFDHPNAFEHSLLRKQLSRLLRGEPVDAPVYNYARHARLDKLRRVEPAPVVVLEGLFALRDPWLLKRMDLSVFIDVPADERLLRRVRRDSLERKVELEFTLGLYERFVRPMHERYIQPTAANATFRWRQLEDKRFPKELVAEIKARLRHQADGQTARAAVVSGRGIRIRRAR